MQSLIYGWRDDRTDHQLVLVPVASSRGAPILFGAASNREPIQIRDFHITSTPVTQALWTHVMGSRPAPEYQPRRPVDNISWNGIAASGGFLERLNASPILSAVTGSSGAPRFRLPSEAEWEFSGSNDIDDVAWYGRRFSAWRRLVCHVLGWKRGWRLVSRPPGWGTTHVHDVALKKPNQLGLYDMTGNVWEWCEDSCGDGAGGGAIGFRLALA